MASIPKNAWLTVKVIALVWVSVISATYPSGSKNVVFYWGQGATGIQKNLASYCTSSTDAIILSFLNNFNVGSLPSLNFAGACETYFSGTSLLSCPQIGKDILTCQASGKKVLLSLGGAVGSYGFSSDSEAVTFANTLWNLFGKGNSSTRPFGDGVYLDGFDLDIEGGGSTGYVALVNQLRSLFATDSSKSYYITAAPQCPFPDAILGSVIDGAGFDAVNVQFYNNYCTGTSSGFNFATWDNWAKTASPNKGIKVFLGIPGSTSAAGSGYVPFSTLKDIIQSTSNYASFGGVVVWDAAQAFSNQDTSPNYGDALGNMVHGGTSSGSAPSVSMPIMTTPTASVISGLASTLTQATVLPTTSPFSNAAQPSSCTDANSCLAEGHLTTATFISNMSTLTQQLPASHATPSVSTAISPSACGATGSCSTEGQLQCASDNSFAICNFGQWTVFPCPGNTICTGTSDGLSVYCGYGSPTACTNQTGGYQAALHVPGTMQAGLSIENANNQTFRGVIQARRLDSASFENNAEFELKTAHNMSIAATTNGKIDYGDQGFKVRLENLPRNTKSLVFSFHGKLDNTSRVVVAPELVFNPNVTVAK